jgi:mannose-6-phosphate isomerase-like protein (cupin superfamily)
MGGLTSFISFLRQGNLSYDSHMEKKYMDGRAFHEQIKKVYFGSLNWAVNKKKEFMARVLYEPAHENRAYNDERKGKGKDFATWIFSEEEGLKENLFATSFELMIDARLDPNASVGLHTHFHTEEIYYILEGSIRMTTVNPHGDERSEELSEGDAHMVRIGQSHYGTAGSEGVRFIVVAIRNR